MRRRHDPHDSYHKTLSGITPSPVHSTTYGDASHVRPISTFTRNQRSRIASVGCAGGCCCCRQYADLAGADAERAIGRARSDLTAIESYKFWDKASVELGDEETPARWRLCETPPTTLAGPVALLNFAVEEQQHLQVPLPDDHSETMVFIESLAQSVRALTVLS